MRASVLGDVRVMLDDKEYSPPEVSAMILAKIKRDAESYLGETITATVEVTAYRAARRIVGNQLFG